MEASQLRFHVTFGQSKKVVRSTVDTLRQNIKNTFDIGDVPYILQCWDNQFDDWIDVDDLSQLEAMDNCKLLVVLRYLISLLSVVICLCDYCGSDI